MTDMTHDILLIAVVSAVTIGLRFLPFLIFRDQQKLPGLLKYLGQVLPFSIMGMLVIYCLRNISFAAAPFGIPEVIGCAVVVMLHLWKRNTLLSITGGTVCYMLLVQLVF